MSSNHLIFGSGLIGTYLGMALTMAGVETLMVARQTWLSRIDKGLSLSDLDGHLTSVIHGKAEEVAQAAHDYAPDILWLTVKCTAVASVLDEVRHYVTPQTTIICCQNGLNSEQRVIEAFPDNLVLKAMVPFNVTIEDEERLHRGTPGPLTVEHYKDAEAVIDFVSRFKSPVLDIILSDDMPSVVWSKLQLNMGNAVNALANVPVKTMLTDKHYRWVVAGLMQEVITVAQAKNIKLMKLTSVSAHLIPKILRLPTFLFKLVANKMLKIDPTVKTSMWWDLHSGHLTEVDFLYGALAEQGKEAGIDCPLASRIVSLVHHAEHVYAQSGQVEGISGLELRSKLHL